MTEKSKLGLYDLHGPAVDRLQLACDDNHADAADEAKALENFRSFSDSYLSTQLKFLGDAKLGE
ncbi:hypothetical protein [Rhizobium sp. HT1-10]|uniref:hypothetical protein n=1 Tax=Rhizobium sp. HT1-10 TaxID=3111638 RepID=UPI003C1BCB76